MSDNVMSCTPFASAIYCGWVRHRRFAPREHQFKYAVFMMYLDVDEVDAVLAQNRWWSRRGWAPARFKRADYLGDPQEALKKSVQAVVKQHTGLCLQGPVRMLTNLRYFGFVINPITIYYCFDDTEQLRALVLEVTNTPWKERHQYVLLCNPEQFTQRITFDKAMHVSPFHPMDMRYHLSGNCPDKKLVVHLRNTLLNAKEETVFDATLCLQRREITAHALTSVIARYPLMTIKVLAAIYWQALKLAVKKVPYFRHASV